jgi:hypothetical protein
MDLTVHNYYPSMADSVLQTSFMTTSGQRCGYFLAPHAVDFHPSQAMGVINIGPIAPGQSPDNSCG